MSRHPTDVGSAPVKILIFDIEDPLRCEMSLQQVTRSCVKDAFGLTRGPGCVKNVEWVFAVQFFGGAVCVDCFHQLVPPEITTGFHVLRRSGSSHDDTGVD